MNRFAEIKRLFNNLGDIVYDYNCEQYDSNRYIKDVKDYELLKSYLEELEVDLLWEETGENRTQ